jgi:predicted SnoaL-like aldol condensation-catalyzing enzyme
MCYYITNQIGDDGAIFMTNKSSIQALKESALDFLHLVVAGDIDEAYDKYVNMHGKHHNVYFSAEFISLKQGMIENHTQFPNKRLMVKNVLGDGNLVAIHSNIVMKTGEPGMAAVHIFRFEEGRIVELWDIGQAIPIDTPNRMGAF